MLPLFYLFEHSFRRIHNSLFFACTYNNELIFAGIFDVNLDNFLNYINNYSKDAVTKYAKLHKTKEDIKLEWEAKKKEKEEIKRKRKELSFWDRNFSTFKNYKSLKMAYVIKGLRSSIKPIIFLALVISIFSCSSTSTIDSSTSTNKDAKIRQMCSEYRSFASRNPVYNDSGARDAFKSDEFEI